MSNYFEEIGETGGATSPVAPSEARSEISSASPKPFDQQKYQKVERTIMVLPQFIKQFGANNPRSKSLLTEVYQGSDVLGEGLAREDRFTNAVRRLNTLVTAGRDVRELREFTRSFVTQHAQELEKGLSLDSLPEVSTACMNLFSDLLTGDEKDFMTGPRIKLGIATLGRHMDVVGAAFQGKFADYDSLPMLRKLLTYGNEKVVQEATAVMQTVVRERHMETIEGVSQAKGESVGVLEKDKDEILFSSLLQKADSSLRARVKPILQAKLNMYGVDGVDMATAWEESGFPHNFDRHVQLNLMAIKNLESIKPGSTKFLTSEYGINDFGRYPWQLLIKQSEEAHDTTKPYGVIIYPRHDENGAFYQDRKLFEDLSAQLSDKYRMIVTESGSKLGIVHALNTLRHVNGPASFGVIGGHGTPDTMTFGKDPIKDVLRISDFQRTGAEALRLAFKEDAPVVFASCETGKEVIDEAGSAHEGLAQIASGVVGIEAKAPVVRTNIEAIQASTDDQGKLHFNVEYSDEGATRTYVKGKTA